VGGIATGTFQTAYHRGLCELTVKLTRLTAMGHLEGSCGNNTHGDIFGAYSKAHTTQVERPLSQCESLREYSKAHTAHRDRPLRGLLLSIKSTVIVSGNTV
jgi:hypothetical protein